MEVGFEPTGLLHLTRVPGVLLRPLGHSTNLMVPEKGLEPLRTEVRGILSPLRLPFRHSGICYLNNIDYLKGFVNDFFIIIFEKNAGLPIFFKKLVFYIIDDIDDKKG